MNFTSRANECCTNIYHIFSFNTIAFYDILLLSKLFDENSRRYVIMSSIEGTSVGSSILDDVCLEPALRFTSSRGISFFLHPLGHGMGNLLHTFRCVISSSTAMVLLQNSQVMSLFGQSSFKCLARNLFSNSAPQRRGHGIDRYLQSS